MSNFLLEIGTEEMPARFLPGLIKETKTLFEDQLQEKEIGYQMVSTFATPRRTVIYVKEISPLQNKKKQKIIGPPVAIARDEKGNYTKAAQGFARSQGVSLEELFEEETPRGRYLAVEKEIGGQKSTSILPEICIKVISSLSFAKRMKWERSKFLFGRPIRWILALFDSEVIRFEIASVNSSNKTWGHRVMGPGPFEIPSAEDYFDILKHKGKVIIDPTERLKIIKEGGEKEALSRGGRIIWDEELMEEVVNLVEYPVALLGEFHKKFLELPREVLLTSIKTHQKSFGVEDKDSGSLLPYFLCTLNIIPQDLSLVKKGWERVLRARLEDAAFFWKVDTQTSLEEWRKELNRVVFMGGLGSMGDKANRIEKISEYLCHRVSPNLIEKAKRAAQLAKVDLVSEMVGEFDDLQGIMGGIYARLKGESQVVADAIYEHYLPAGPDSPLPKTILGSILSISDKADNIIGCFGMGMIPTGAQDPHGLRRQCLGIIRIILNWGFKFSISQLFSMVWDTYGEIEWKMSKKEVMSSLNEFVLTRLKGMFQGEGYPTRLIDATLGAGYDDIYTAKKRLDALKEFSTRKDFETSVLTFKRVYNIIKKQGEKTEEDLSGEYNPNLFQEKEEKALGSLIEEISPRWEELTAKEDFISLFELLPQITPTVNAFFDKVMVMAEDQELRKNRLNLLMSLVKRLSSLCDFSALQI